VTEQDLRELIHDVGTGRLGRRQFVQSMLGRGLTALAAAQMLTWPWPATAQPTSAPEGVARRGGGGTLRLIAAQPQTPTQLNPHHSIGADTAVRLFYEPLAAFDPDAKLVPVLAAEIPTVETGTLAKDGTWVIWHLKKDVVWHDGRPFTADDVIFTWRYSADPATGTSSMSRYQEFERVERLGDHAVRIVFREQTPFWFQAFCGDWGLVLPRHLFETYRGARAREAPWNLRPVGTGPYRFVSFKPGDELRAELNRHYHVPGRPRFDAIELKGGGDAVSAVRAVLQTGGFDLALGALVDDEILTRLEQAGKGKVGLAWGSDVEQIQLNQTDPWTEVDGERSSLKAPHPFLSDVAVRRALAVLVDRDAIQREIFGRLGRATANILVGPPQFRSPNTTWAFSVNQANEALDAAGWPRGPDGVRVRHGTRLRLVFQVPSAAVRQRVQAIVKQACRQAGIELELKTVLPSVYYSSDPSNPDTLGRFQTDLQMHAVNTGPDPQRLMEAFTSWNVATRENQWAGRNRTRWRHDGYDRLYAAAKHEMDPVKRAALFIQMNDLVIREAVVIPVVWRSLTVVMARTLRNVATSPWDSIFFNVADWHRET
jgi:peptide/nickel transport system substrate-binding protein